MLGGEKIRQPASKRQVLSLKTAMLVFPIRTSAVAHHCSHPPVRVTSQVTAKCVSRVYCYNIVIVTFV